ncbi:hypothetical protein MVEN_00650600 [Mycena venus]|uniref:F-box domain-containing protein n=1 Tax=Mycena venus TaxID=2733690 RepID=A0A8H6YS87_9AGAR|nr:hypothetical protein MVEN_00650600 [Mycena venus]
MSVRLWHLQKPLSFVILLSPRAYFEFVAAFGGLEEFSPALNLSFPFGSIFPNLKSLTLWRWDTEELPYIRLFLTPTLSNLTFECGPSIVESLFLSVFGRICPEPKVLDVAFYAEDLESEVAIAQFWRSLWRVEALSIDFSVLDLDALIHFGRLPTFTSMSLATLPRLRPSTIFTRPLCLGLRNLAMGSVKLETMIQFLKIASPIALNTLDLSLTTVTPQSRYKETLTSLCIGHSPIAKPIAVYSAVRYEELKTREKQWKDAAAFLPEFVAIREEERSRARGV